MVMEAKAKVAVVDDHPLFRQGLATAIRGTMDLEVAGDAGNANDAIELVSTLVIDLVIVDILMPTMSGISLAAEIYDRRPDCKILGLSVIDEPGLIADMLRAHASGYALKTQGVDEILDAIRQVLGGIRYLPPSVSRDAIEELLDSPPHKSLDRLTRREREIFELVIRGRSSDEIATELSISRRTVETHRQRVMRKLSAHSLAQMQRIAARHGGLGT